MGEVRVETLWVVQDEYKVCKYMCIRLLGREYMCEYVFQYMHKNVHEYVHEFVCEYVQSFSDSALGNCLCISSLPCARDRMSVSNTDILRSWT